MNELVKWATNNALKPGQLATILVIIFLALFMGLLPSPMLSAIDQVTEEHQGILDTLKKQGYILTQICVNGARTVEAERRCYYEGPR